MQGVFGAESRPVGVEASLEDTGGPVRVPSGTAPGYRHRDTGALWNVGNSGYSWGSTFDGNNGMHLSFRATWLHPNDSYHRAYGFQLRCLSE